MSRIRQSPGIEINEIDRSQYETSRGNNLVDTTTLVLGFSNKGDNYDIKEVVSQSDLETKFGVPETGEEAELYFYNACYEAIKSRGKLLAAKLPYDNNSLNKCQYVEYTLSDIEDIFSIDGLLNSAKEKYCKPSITIQDETVYFESTIDAISINKISSIINGSISSEETEFGNGLIDYITQKITINFENKEKFYGQYNATFSGLDNLKKLFNKNIEELINNDLSSEEIQLKEQFETYGNLVKEYISTLTKDEFLNFYEDWNQLVLKYIDSNANLCSFYSQISSVNNDFINDLSNNETIDIGQICTESQKCLRIGNSISSNGMMLLTDYDKLLVDEYNLKNNTIRIVDIANNSIEKDDFGNDVFGYMPIITTPADALYYQNYIQSYTHSYDRTIIQKCVVNSGYDNKTGIIFDGNGAVLDGSNDNINFSGLIKNLGNENSGYSTDTITTDSLNDFPRIRYSNGTYDNETLKKIGIVVFKVYKDTANNNKIGFIPVESFVGTLNKNDVDSVTKEKLYIEDVVNSNSSIINVFVNIDSDIVNSTDIYAIKEQFGTILGFRSEDIVKNITVDTSILDAMSIIFKHAKDINTYDIDILVDAGVSTIGQFIYSVYGKTKKYGIYKNNTVQKFDLTSNDASFFKYNTSDDVSYWKLIVQKFDEFCKSTRKDCMFIADSPRSFCLEGNYQIIRKTNPQRTVENTIIPRLKLISDVINSSYSAGYCDWFLAKEYSSDGTFWCPPSIKALQAYLFTDVNANFWNAPAGLNRGVINDAYDVAFNPPDVPTWDIYQNQWNYSFAYPLDGIVIEGQKTFQKNKTALDRVNVRRLMLGIEKHIYSISRYFNYEQNTEWNRSVLKDRIDSYLYDVQGKDGILDFRTICDETNNTENTIDNNELHVTIAIKPVKAIEFIVLNFICTNQSSDVNEIS